jgi:general stress protein YciG
MAKKKIPPEVADVFRKFGKQGGKKRSKNLTPEQRSEIARKAGKAGGRGRKKDGNVAPGQ